MSDLYVLPLLLAVLLCLPVLLAPVSERASLLLSRVAIPVFGFYVANRSARRDRQRDAMRAAHVGGTHRVYAARTLLLAGVLGVAGSVFGVYAAAGVLQALQVPAEVVESTLPSQLSFVADLARAPTLSLVELFGLLLASSATVGTTLALGTYWARWQFLDQRARARSTQIEATLPRTVAFVYALSRSGMPFPKVLETLNRNDAVYGEAAREVGVAVRDMNVFGTDVLTALRRTGERTPSENMSEFAENLASVLGSGRSLSGFLREQYERYQEEAEAQQQQYLELLATFAEIYVTVLVAGPLFLITVLVIVGLVLSNTLPVLQFVTYVGIPLASFGFVVYIDSITQDDADVAVPDDEGTDPEATRGPPRAALAGDGGAVDVDADGHRANRERLAAYDRLRPVRRVLGDPVGAVLDRPELSFLVTVPVGFAWLALRAGPDLAGLPSRFRLALPSLSANGVLSAVDDPLIEGTMLVLAGFALVYELQKRRKRTIEEAIPDFLDRMASVNEAGLTVVASLDRVSEGELGRLGEELARTRRDIAWGADAKTALQRMERRIGTPSVTRSVTLITNAMDASGDVAPVLRIAADEAQQSRRLRRERRQEMLTYLLVIYVSFLVFLGIIVALTTSFVPAIEQANQGLATGGAGTGGAGPTAFAGLRDVDTDAYTLLFYHIAAIQGVCSGLIAGQLGEGRLLDGFKHGTVLLLVAYLTFVVL
jgi:flagellar protein FlaJ